ncbi:MAG: hypothetical protein DMG88_06595 [Acidobacteria bacterium]|nr:MAG: hypothetical protein DMG88_06595 [Acidobacteriota bacterium]
MYFPSALLVFGIHGLNAFHRESHHGLIADSSCEGLVAHSSDVQVGVAAVDACISWRRSVAKCFVEAADFRPPIQRFCRVGGRQHRNRAFDDRLHLCPIEN